MSRKNTKTEVLRILGLLRKEWDHLDSGEQALGQAIELVTAQVPDETRTEEFLRLLKEYKNSIENYYYVRDGSRFGLRYLDQDFYGQIERAESELRVAFARVAGE